MPASCCWKMKIQEQDHKECTAFWLELKLRMRTVRPWPSKCFRALADSNDGVIHQCHISMGCGVQR